MTDKEKIRKEVEKIARSINPYIPDEEGKNSEYEAGRFAMATQIMQIIDSLQEEPVSEDLEEAAWMHYDRKRPPMPPEWDLHREFIEFFKAGAKWQKERLTSKACAWLEENYDSCDYMPNDYGEYYGKDKFIEHFRKAMEDN